MSKQTIEEFYVEYIHNVEWNDCAFERLVLPEDSKDLLLTLVKNHGQMREIGQDIVPGKGILDALYRPFKILTAKQVADSWSC